MIEPRASLMVSQPSTMAAYRGESTGLPAIPGEDEGDSGHEVALPGSATEARWSGCPTRIIRQLPQRQAVPILAMTANAFEEDRKACLNAGMNDYITKPVDPDTLYSKILQWLPSKPSH